MRNVNAKDIIVGVPFKNTSKITPANTSKWAQCTTEILWKAIPFDATHTGWKQQLTLVESSSFNKLQTLLKTTFKLFRYMIFTVLKTLYSFKKFLQCCCMRKPHCKGFQKILLWINPSLNLFFSLDLCSV